MGAGSRSLTALAGLGLVGAGVTAALVGLDPRVLTGAPVWVKPFKFFVSTALYTGTLALLFAEVPGRRRAKAVVGGGIAAVLVVELVLIVAQAARGVRSHFNVATPLDAAVFAAMGVAILLLSLLTLGALVLMARDRTADPAWRRAAVGALAVVLVAGAVAVPMTTPNGAQRAAWAAGAAVVESGAHTVGGPDGGPGLPLVGWSTVHGDLRVAHFVGLHALQTIPLAALALRRSRRLRTTRAQVRAVTALAAGYGGVVLVLFAQALRGQSVAHPDALTLALFAAVAAATAAGLRGATRG